MHPPGDRSAQSLAFALAPRHAGAMCALHGTRSAVITEVDPPASPDTSPDWRHAGVTMIDEALAMEVDGNTDLADTTAMLVGSLANQRNVEKHLFIAVDESDPQTVLGRARVNASRRDNLHAAWVEIGVLPSARRRGIGSGLWQRALEQVRTMGRTTVMTATSTAPEPAEDETFALSAPTGVGRVDTRDEGVRFARSLGFSLEQVERHSVLDLPVDPDLLKRLGERSAAAAGPDYALVSWHGRVPDEWLEHYCILQTRMSTDSPLAGLDLHEAEWDPERVEAHDKVLRDMGVGTITTAALHRPSRTLAGFTVIETPREKAEVVGQEYTLVLKEHRGHRLGMLVKAANLQLLARDYPQARRIHTGNAQENSFMLDINVALGFRQASVWGAWQLVL